MCFLSTENTAFWLGQKGIEEYNRKEERKGGGKGKGEGGGEGEEECTSKLTKKFYFLTKKPTLNRFEWTWLSI